MEQPPTDRGSRGVLSGTLGTARPSQEPRISPREGPKLGTGPTRSPDVEVLRAHHRSLGGHPRPESLIQERERDQQRSLRRRQRITVGGEAAHQELHSPGHVQGDARPAPRVACEQFSRLVTVPRQPGNQVDRRAAEIAKRWAIGDQRPGVMPLCRTAPWMVKPGARRTRSRTRERQEATGVTQGHRPQAAGIAHLPFEAVLQVAERAGDRVLREDASERTG